MLTGEGGGGDWVLADSLFSAKRMYSRLVTTAQLEKLPETYRALPYIKKKHRGQFRKPVLFSQKPVPYIVHPLMLVCHALALGIREDAVLATALLHDVCEDCGVAPDDLPFSEPVREAVTLLSFRQEEGESKEDAKKRYYDAIGRNRIAVIVKILDRCNNISTMAGSFTEEKLAEYIDETEACVMPLLDKAKYSVQEYADAFHLIKYHMRSVLETVKAMMLRQNA